MQISAYKDPTTGKIFESESDFQIFQEEQAKILASAIRVEQVRARLLELPKTVANGLKTPSDMEPLVEATYREVLALLEEFADLRGVRRTKAERKRKFEVVSVSATDFQIKPYDYSAANSQQGLVLHFNLKVVLNHEPYYRLLCPEIQELSYRYVIDGSYTYSGSSFEDESTGNYTMRYSIRIPVDKLPLLKPQLKKIAQLQSSKENHERAVSVATHSAYKQSTEICEAIVELRNAQADVDAALARRAAAEELVENAKNAVAAKVESELPFAQEQELCAAQEGFEGVYQLDAYTVLANLP